MNPDQIAERVFKSCDENKDGTISMNEFAMTLYFFTKAPKEEKLSHIFNLLDFDGNGMLSSQEVVQAIKHAYDIRGDLNFDYNSKGIEVFRKMDKDGDLRVNRKEFIATLIEDEKLCQLLEDILGYHDLVK